MLPRNGSTGCYFDNNNKNNNKNNTIERTSNNSRIPTEMFGVQEARVVGYLPETGAPHGWKRRTVVDKFKMMRRDMYFMPLSLEMTTIEKMRYLNKKFELSCFCHLVHIHIHIYYMHYILYALYIICIIYYMHYIYI
eukprot:GHVR01106152.1.p1 GENE.GHVR01106152.1~~GHVR01106152.1.p1  ORF type:complete len:137 (+),score=31.56 GHVR01106152.1:349-759(+)